MIRIKVYPLRKLIAKLELAILYITSLLVLVIFFVLLFEKREEIFRKIVIEEETNFSAQKSLLYRVVKQKIPALEFVSSSMTEEGETHENRVVQDSDNTSSVEHPKHDSWVKPSMYETSFLENGKVKVGTAVIKNSSKINLNLEELKFFYFIN